MLSDDRPLFQQIADSIADRILDDSYPEESQVPSTNEFAAFHRINPATAAKGVNVLVDDGVLYKKRGIGMFVATGAKRRIAARRRDGFVDAFVRPMLREADSLGISGAELTALIDREGTR